MKTTTALIPLLFVLLTAASAQNQTDDLIVFVGKKMAVTYAPEAKKEEPIRRVIVGKDTQYVRPVTIRMDSRYVARYKVLELVHGSYRKRNIEFTAFDHYGEPAFSKHATVLLFVSRHKGQLYHEKYQYFALYPTQDGRLASPYAAGSYDHPYKADITVKPERIHFKNDVSFPVDQLSQEDIAKLYPAPYYIIKGDRAVAEYGNYVEDLFTLEKQTVLKARGFY